MDGTGLTLRQLERMATAFDEISDETGARYAAAAFVTYVRAELAARAEGTMTRELQAAGARRHWDAVSAG